MKYLTHYLAEYRLVGAKGFNRGEIGGIIQTQAFETVKDAIDWVNQWRSVGDKNIYDPVREPVNRKSIQDPKDGEESELFHLNPPKIWNMNFRGDWRSIEEAKKRGYKHNWRHIEGDTYDIKFEYFNLKTRKMEYSSLSFNTLEEAVKELKIKDTKTRLASDFTFYSKHLESPK